MLLSATYTDRVLKFDITIRFIHRYFSKRPHVGGTKRSKDLASEIARRWRDDYKFDKVEEPEYDILLPYVNPNVSNSVQILNSTGDVTFEFSGREKVFHFTIFIIIIITIIKN